MHYAGFWDRLNRSTVYAIIVLTAIILADFLKKFHENDVLIFLVLATVIAVFYECFRKRFMHIVLVKKDGTAPSFFRRTFRQLCDLIPLLIIGLYAWFASLHMEEGINQLINIYKELGDEEPNKESSTIEAFFTAFFFLSPYYFLLWAVWELPVIFTKTKRSISDYLAGTCVIYNNYSPSSWKSLLLKAPVTTASALLIAFILTFNAWYIYNIPDQELNPEFESFFYDDPFDPSNNFHVAWAGIYAPLGEQDLYSYGLQVANKKIDPKNENSLRFNGDIDNLCYSQDDLLENKDCLKPEQSKNLFQKNKILISRYQALHKQSNRKVSIGNKFSISGAYGQDIISMQQLLAVRWIEQAKNGKGQDALEEWLSSTKSIRHVVTGKITLVEHAIWMITHGINLKVLPVILEADPAIIPLYQDRIIQVLGTDYMNIWNVEDMMRAEYNVMRLLNISKINNNLFFKPNATRNKFFELANDMIFLSKQPVQNMLDEQKRIYSKYDCPKLRCFTYNLGSNLLLSGFAKGGEMFFNAHSATAQQRAIILWMKAKLKELSPAEMENFLQTSEASLHDPLTDKPFKWDAEKKSIYFVRPKSRVELYY